MYHMSEQMAEVAASWWTNKVDGYHIHDNGDISQASQLACGIADLFMKPITSETAEKFKQRLKKKLLDIDMDVDYYKCWLSVDYSPCRLLRETALEVGIDESNFPFKIDMHIKKKKIVVINGYGMAPETIYTES